MSDTIIKSLIALGAQIPLFGAFLVWQAEAQQHPTKSLLIALLYELGVLVLAFSKKVWARLEEEATKSTAEWIKASLRRLAPGFRRRYQKQIITEHGIFNVRGLGLINAVALELNQVFVDLRIVTSTNPGKPNLDPIAVKPAELAGTEPIWHFLRHRRKIEATALAITGAPGSGKTTLLQHIALTYASNQQHRYGIREDIPIFLFIRDLAESVAASDPPSLGAYVENHFSKKYQHLKVPREWFEQQLRKGKCIVLLDGLDEVAELGKRKAISEWVDTQVTIYPACQFILTSRPQGYLDAKLERADQLEVQPFVAAQVEKFVRSWYLANETKTSAGQLSAPVRERALKEANDLLHLLRTKPSLSALTANPLLLTMVAMVHKYHGALPGSRTELYAEICEVLLGRWRQGRGVKESLTAAQKLVVMRPLASYMMENNLRDIGFEEAMKLIRPIVKRVGVDDEEAEHFLPTMQANSGLLLEREVGRWSFTHLTFQEYLTASHWREEKVADKEWVAMVTDSWWHETLRLYAALGDATPIVQACLQSNLVPALMIAADCLDESRELDPLVRKATMNLLINDLESSEQARQQLAAEVQLSRRLNKSLQPIDERIKIDMGYVTCAEYQLFLEDMRNQGMYYQPDHWCSHRFPAGEARKPIAGVSLEDASAFCEWLTRRQSGGGGRYRLPRPDEAQRIAAEDRKLTAWCTDGTSYELVGLASEDEGNIKQRLAALSPLPVVPSIRLARGRLLALMKDDPSSTYLKGIARSFAHAIGYRVDQNINDKLATTLGESIVWGFDRSLDNDRTLNRARTQELARARDLAHSLEEKTIVIAIEANQISSAYNLAQAAVMNQNSNSHGLLSLLTEMLAIASAETALAARLAQRRFAALILEYAFRGHIQDEADGSNASLAQRFKFSRLGRAMGRVMSTVGKEYEADILELYWLLQVTIARECGKLDAWEGIRIVREDH